MNLEKYLIIIAESAMEYYFTSTGIKGNIHKVVQYALLMGLSNVPAYNLAFGDLKPDGSFDDECATNNGDAFKTLNTVAYTVMDFLRKHPGCKILARGNTNSRTRLYRRIISLNYELLQEDVNIYGLEESKWVIFRTDGNFKAFYIEEKLKLYLL